MSLDRTDRAGRPRGWTGPPPDGIRVPVERGRHADRRRHRGRVGRAFEITAIALTILLVPVLWSYAHALAATGSASVGARTVEWMSDHGMRGVVLFAERWWYGHHQPPVGGTPSGGLPEVRSTDPATAPPQATVPHLERPVAIAPIAARPLPHEGAWRPIGRWLHGYPSMLAAYLRPDPVHTSLVTGVVWIDTKLVRTVLVPGTQQPGGAVGPWGAEVPRSKRGDLLGAFNSGFKMVDARGGYYQNGHSVVPLVDGAASLVIFDDGTATVAKWGRDQRVTPTVTAVRQNLALIVDHGRPVKALANSSLRQWGATLGNQYYVWRSGVGVTASGALVYAAGPGLSVQSLATVLARAGAVRAMELDINTEWTTFNIFSRDPGSPTGVFATKLLPNMYRPATRYLVRDERDFFALFAR